jgi:hypothetical protein
MKLSETKYKLMWKNIYVGNLIRKQEKLVPQHIREGKVVRPLRLNSFDYEPVRIREDLQILSFPIGIYPATLVAGQVVPDITVIPSNYRISNWLRGRIVPEDRENLEEILNMLGLEHYNVWQINKLTRSMCLEDDYWIMMDDSDNYEELHPRYLIKTNQTDKLMELRRKGVLFS